jgi:hypothetical protein
VSLDVDLCNLIDLIEAIFIASFVVVGRLVKSMSSESLLGDFLLLPVFFFSNCSN